MTPYYADDWVTIYHGDCLEILPTLPEVDLYFTSPPYNLGNSTGGGMNEKSGYYGPGGRAGGTLGNVAALTGGYGDYGDDLPHDEYDEWQRAAVAAMWATLSDRGAIFYNHKPRPMNGEVKLPLIYGAQLPLRQIVIWDREYGMNFSPTHFLPKSEWIVIWAKPGWRLVDKKASGLGDVWRIRPEGDDLHPAPFPLALAQTAIGATTAGLVVDPFMGSGTTLRAAKNLGRRAIGVELDERYCEIAARRCAQEVLTL